MVCDDFKEHIDAYIHGNLDTALRAQFVEHLKECPLCRLKLDEEEGLEKLLRHYIPKENAPYALKEGVIQRIEQTRRFSFLPDFSWVKAGWGLAFAGLIFAVLAVGLFRGQAAFPLFTESVASHMDFLGGSYPMEIKSHDIRQVTNWFEGKLDFALKVPEMANSAIQLQGARLCHLKDQKVAYLSYALGRHRISAFVIDMEGIKIPKARRIERDKHIFYVSHSKGYQSILCLNKEAPGMGCIFVSDLPEEEFLHLII